VQVFRRVLISAGAAAASVALSAPALAGPVATSDPQYQAYGAVFPDPLADCKAICDPRARGNIGAKTFIGYTEFLNGLRFMNQVEDWQRYMELWPLDGKLDGGAGSAAGSLRGDDVPGNNLPASAVEFTPSRDFVSAGLPTTGIGRQKSDLVVVRVTDEAVPDTFKKRYALSLGIHGIERAGVEGGVRAMEELVTAVSRDGGLDEKLLAANVRGGGPTIRAILQNTIVYFTFPNPDGWRRGSIQEGGASFQRYNGNGVDPNRDWPDIGFTYRFYSPESEPETKAFLSFYNQVMERGGPFAAGDDLHGQPFADALSYTMLPHGRHDWGKNLRILGAVVGINRATYEAVKWSPIIQDNDRPKGGGAPCGPDVLGETCAKIYGQTWGTVYDTINYTTTGALGDWFDSTVGLNADGIDNEMSFSHLDRDTRFDPHTEQLHVAGNKAIIYSHIAEILAPPSRPFDAKGTKGYVPNKRLTRGEQDARPAIPPGTTAQAPVEGQTDSEFPFTVKRGPQPADGSGDAGKNVYNGGLRVDATVPNIQGITINTYPANEVGMKVQCRGCDAHRGGDEDEEWITVAEDYNQRQLYFSAGLTVAVNSPQPYTGDGKPVEWRVLMVDNPPGAPVAIRIEFMQGQATSGGNTGGDPPPRLRAYDVANTDYMRDLNRFIESDGSKFREVDPRKVLSGEQSLSGLANLVLADDPLPGYKGLWTDPPGPPPADLDYTAQGGTRPGLYQPDIPPEARQPGTYETVEFSIKPGEDADGVDIQLSFENGDDDWDLYLYRKTEDGELETVDSSTGGFGSQESINLRGRMARGDYVVYVDNWLAQDPNFKLSIKFVPAPGPPSDTGEYSDAERDAWMAKLREYVEQGGNLVLTDGALRVLSGVAGLPKDSIRSTTVYAGQVAFQKEDGQPTNDDVLLNAPLTINQQGARFNSGMRRQMYEPTPLGFAIQSVDRAGDDESNAIQWDIDRKAYEAVANARLVGTSVNSGARDAEAVDDRVAMGEVKIGKGQVRFVGALLPQPTTRFDHDFGLEPYAVTVTGYLVFRNLLATAEEQARGTVAGFTSAGSRKPRFLISRRLTRMNLRGVVPVRVSCRATGGCRGTLLVERRRVVRIKGKRRVRYTVLGKKRFNIRAKRRAVLRVRLRPRARRSVRRRPRTVMYGSAAVAYREGRRQTVGPVRFRVSRPKG